MENSKLLRKAFDDLRFYVDASDTELEERGITREEALRIARESEGALLAERQAKAQTQTRGERLLELARDLMAGFVEAHEQRELGRLLYDAALWPGNPLRKLSPAGALANEAEKKESAPSKAVDFYVCDTCGHYYMDDGITCDCSADAIQPALRHVRMVPDHAADRKPEVGQEDVYALIGHAELLKIRGQHDMPTYILGLASRLARDIGDSLLSEIIDAMAPNWKLKEGSDV